MSTRNINDVTLELVNALGYETAQTSGETELVFRPAGAAPFVGLILSDKRATLFQGESGSLILEQLPRTLELTARVSGVLPRDCMYDLGRVETATDGELSAALERGGDSATAEQVRLHAVATQEHLIRD